MQIITKESTLIVNDKKEHSHQEEKTKLNFLSLFMLVT